MITRLNVGLLGNPSLFLGTGCLDDVPYTFAFGDFVSCRMGRTWKGFLSRVGLSPESDHAMIHRKYRLGC